MSLVALEQVTKEYTLGGSRVPALRGVSLTVETGEFLAIVGPSGSGKTTLLNLIGCLEPPTGGAIRLDGQDVSRLSSDALATFRAHHLGFVFQTFNLFPVLTALENVEYPLYAKRCSRAERRRLAMAALEQVGLAAFARHKPMELSGGQRQRVAIARAVVIEPRLVLADEPTANLDYATGQEILRLMRRINEERRTTVIFSTHDQRVMQRAGRIVWLRDGVIAEPER